MRFALTEDQTDFRAAVRDLLADTCPSEAVRAAWREPVGEIVGGGDGRVRAAWDALAEMGVLGVMVPEESGGLGMGDEDLVPLLVECGRVALPDPVSSTAYVASGLLRDNTSDPARALLGRIADGSATVGVGFSGSANLTAAATIDAFLMCDRDEVHLLGSGDVSIRPVQSVDGARALGVVDWEPSGDTLIVSGEAGSHAVTRAFDRAALGAAAQLVGLGGAMIDMTVAYAGERRQFGVPIGSFQAVSHRAADCFIDVECIRWTTWQAISRLARNGRATREVAVAKFWAAEGGARVTSAAQHLHGGIGADLDYPIHRYFLWSKALELSLGGAHEQLERLGRDMVERGPEVWP